MSKLDSNCKEIIIWWIPSHIEVRENESTDSTARSALGLTPYKFKIPYTDLKPKINEFVHTKWQKCWNNNIYNKLFQLKPTLGEWRPAFRISRRERVIIFQLHIGHTSLTHSFILKQEYMYWYVKHLAPLNMFS